MPVILKIFTIFLFILILNRKFPLGIALFSGSFLLCLWMGFDFSFFVQSGIGSLKELTTISLVLIVATILIMSALMQSTGQIERMVFTFQELTASPGLVASVMPALIGLLPMPGGALFSAPMVEAGVGKECIEAEKKVALNYWFRHIWEYWWPLYPGVVLAIALLKVPAWKFIGFMLLPSVLSVVAGKVFILNFISCPLREKKKVSFSLIKKFLWEIMPIVIVVISILVLSLLEYFLHKIGVNLHIPGSTAIIPGLLLSLVWIMFTNKVSVRELKTFIYNKKFLNMVFLVISIMIFKNMLAKTNAVFLVREELIAYHIPLVLVVMIMPFLSGFITGIAIGFVGASFPLIIPMFPEPSSLSYLSWAALAYTFGYMGMMLSPVHLCFLVTKDYFQANLLASYKYLLKPVLFVVFLVLVLFGAGVYWF